MEIKSFDVIFQIVQTRKCTINYTGNIKSINIQERIDIENSTLIEQTDPEIITTITPGDE